MPMPSAVEALFLAALERPSPAERAAYLAAACGGDAALRKAVDRLLAAHDRAGDFLEHGPLPPSSADTGAPDMAAGKVVGPYVLVQLLGEGGMGTVWAAEQRYPVKRRVALKIIKAGMDSAQVVRRFEQERQVLALMDHPNIAKVLDAGTTEQGRPYFVMELVKGVPLTTYCDELNLPLPERLALMLPVCRAVQHAHHKGIIHRDLKPSNVLVCFQDGKPAPRVIDFGVAKALHQRLTEESLVTEMGALVGTLEYMAPEQAELSALDVDTRADIYALGALLYELLTGSTPLDRKRLRATPLTEVLRIIKEEELPAPSTRLTASQESLPALAARRRTVPSQLTRAVRGELDWIVMKCLEKDRTRRYDSAGALAADLQRYLSDEPVEACPPSRWYRTRKMLRKQRMSVAMAVLALVLVVAGSAASLWQAARATDAEANAVTAKLAAETDRDRARSAERLARERLVQVSKEKERAEAAEKMAVAQSAVAAVVNDFLQKDLLGQADIAQQQGGGQRDPNVKVRVLLDRAAKSIEGRFADQPLTEAAIRLTLGDTYRALGNYPEARRHLERAVALRTLHLGADHADTLRAKNSLGLLFHLQGRADLAEPLYLEVLAARTRKLGPDHLDTLTVKNNLALLYHVQARFDLAEKLLLEVIAGWAGQRGAGHPGTMQAKHSLAEVYRALGKYEAAEALLREALAGLSAKFGADHPDVLIVRSDLALLLKTLGCYDLAEPIYEDVLTIRTRHLGPRHIDTLVSKNNLAALRQAQGRFPAAEALFKEAVADAAAELGDDHPQTLTFRSNLGLLYLALGQHSRAEPLLVSVLAGRSATLDADHPDLLMAKNNLASLYMAQRRFPAAEVLLKEVLAARIARQGVDHPETVNSRFNLATWYLAQGRHADAEPIVEQVYAAWLARFGADHPQTLLAQHTRATIRVARGHPEEGEDLFLKAINGRAAKLGADHPDTLLSKHDLGALYFSRGELARAEALFREAAEGARRRLTLAHPYTQTYYEHLANCYDAQSKFAKAEELWREQADYWKEHAGPEAVALGDKLARLGLSLLQQQKYAAAEPVLRECLEIRGKKQPDAWETFDTMSDLGVALLGQAKYEAAEKLLLEGCDGLRKRAAKIPAASRQPVLTEAMERLVDLYDNWGKKDEAERWRRELAGAKKTAPGIPAPQ